VGWTFLLVVVLSSGILTLALALRRVELARMQRGVQRRAEAVRDGAAVAELAHPVVDLTRCLGCGTCVSACPEDGVLELVHGQAMVVRGARCRGHAACERECPTGAITVRLDGLAEREDVPVLDESLEAVGAPGLFLAGELTAHALIKTAIEHGTAVAREVARRGETEYASATELDLCIVGAGPAGLACSLEAKRLGVSYVTLDRAGGPGGTVATYPRKKLVVSEPVELPLVGMLDQRVYEKEELVELWEHIAAKEDLPIRHGETLEWVESLGTDAGGYRVHTGSGTIEARHVCLAMGRRGVPNTLGVPGEDLPKVANALLDAQSYRDRRILVVGGGDSAVEAALGLAEQPGNRVTLAHRRSSFPRIRGANEARLEAARAEGRLEVLTECEVEEVRQEAVALRVRGEHGPERRELQNDDVFVMIGGTAPVELLQRSGVSCDPELRASRVQVERADESGNAMKAVAIGFVLSLAVLAFALWNADYYRLGPEARPEHPKHQLLRPGLNVGLAFGITGTVLIALNLLYLARRSGRGLLRVGSLRLWMTSHVATGLLALLVVTLHAALTPGDTAGGHAYGVMALLVVTGAIGRYLYAYVPRATNGRELVLSEVKARLGSVSVEWDQGQRRFRSRVRAEVTEVVERRQWKSSFAGRLLALLTGQRAFRRTLRALAGEGRAEGVSEDEIAETMALARRAHRLALMTAHYEDLRAILSTWRYVHRWGAALLVLLVLVHVVSALVYGAHLFGGGGA
jgi:thioredoxin reductase/Pyruvate/2-oxoacid:ferredoxin oxidoreductase delta subunit